MNLNYRFILENRERNLFSKDSPGNKPGFEINESNGEVSPEPDFAASDFIKVVPELCYWVTEITRGAFYDKNKKYIGAIYSVGESGVINAPRGAAFMRISVPIQDFGENTFFIYESRIAYPLYKDDISLAYERENNQRFYREKFSGKLIFTESDYEYIANADIERAFYLLIEQRPQNAKYWRPLFLGRFYKTDCEINDDDRAVRVQPNPVDNYNEVLAGVENEYNLTTLAPEIKPLLLEKRPLIQLYVPGDSVISCFLSGMNFEQDANIITDEKKLVKNYFFALCNILKEIKITGASEPNARDVYTGKMEIGVGANSFTGELYPNSQFTPFYIYISQTLVEGKPIGAVLVEIREKDTDKPAYRFTRGNTGQPFTTLEFDLTAVPSSGYKGTMHADMKGYNVYGRYLCDVRKIGGLVTYPIPADDIVDNNRNYRRVIGYAINVAHISNNFSIEPTEYGLAENGKYFAPPLSACGSTFFPIARSTWRYSSLWFEFEQLDWQLEHKARAAYYLRDTFPLHSVINVLLKQFAPNVKHEATPEYSEFLYGKYNPISDIKFRLFITQKTNLLYGNYKEPAKKSPITLQQIFTMLRDTFKCYWFIQDGKLRIEHIKYFENGGGYNIGPVISTDLTALQNPRNGKKWAFATSKFSYDRIEMPERYQFNWGDDTTLPFRGYPIEVTSKFVTPGKVEDVNIPNFTSDVDLMLLDPGAFNPDGFALFAAVTADAIAGEWTPGYLISEGTNGQTTPRIPIKSQFKGRLAELIFGARGGGKGRVIFFNQNAVISTQGNFTSAGTQKIHVQIPDDATDFAFSATGNVSANIGGLKIPGTYQLPYLKIIIDGVRYELQNGYLAFVSLQPTYWVYGMPAKSLIVNGAPMYAKSVARNKVQTISYPSGISIKPAELVKTYLGNGEISKINVNLCSLTAKATLKYDTK